jgi:hypothetical protein
MSTTHSSRTPKHYPLLTIEQKITSGGLLSLRGEFCQWAGISAVTAYKEAAAGHLKLTKIRGRTMVAAPDAIAFRDNKRGVA